MRISSSHSGRAGRQAEGRAAAKANKPFEEARAAARDADGAPFSRFLERDRARQKRDRRRRLTLGVSLGIHVIGLLALIGYSVFQVDELFSPSVEVKMMRTSQLPPGVVTPLPPPPPPTP
ncbi:MAG TPA: hypothetical protein VGF45_00440 [Polyangia bacterium]